jgi:ferredoxin
LQPLRLLSMSYTVRIAPGPLEFAADGAQSLLEAAEVGGVALDSSCRNGTCRTCLCRLSHGQVRYRIEWPGVSAEEKTDGWILPCVACATSDLVLDASTVRLGFGA